MPDQDQTATPSVDAGDGHSLYAPNGAVIRRTNGHTEAPAAPLPDDLPDQIPGQEPRQSEPPTQSIQFWQGLVVGLAAAIVILFFIAVVLAG